MIIKDGVDLHGLSHEIWEAAKILENVLNVQGVSCVITSGREGKHMIGSKHYEGQALDFRSRDLKRSYIDELIPSLRRLLKGHRKGYDVLFEGNHIHIEYDPK